MGKFSTKEGFLFYPSTIQAEEKEKIDAFLSLLDESGVERFIKDKDFYEVLGRPEYNSYSMFSAVLYGFAMGSPSLRDLESSCRNDLRYMYIMEGRTPSYAAFSRFINTVIKPNAFSIFTAVVKTIFQQMQYIYGYMLH